MFVVMEMEASFKKWVTGLFSAISFLVILCSAFVLTDRLVPGEIKLGKILLVRKVVERESKKLFPSSAFLVETEDHTVFPIYQSDYEYFEVGDVVTIYYSRFMHRRTQIKNSTQNFSSWPAFGLYSHFFWLVPLALMGGVGGIALRQYIGVHFGLVLLSLGVVLVLYIVSF